MCTITSHYKMHNAISWRFAQTCFSAAKRFNIFSSKERLSSYSPNLLSINMFAYVISGQNAITTMHNYLHPSLHQSATQICPAVYSFDIYYKISEIPFSVSYIPTTNFSLAEKSKTKHSLQSTLLSNATNSNTDFLDSF